MLPRTFKEYTAGKYYNIDESQYNYASKLTCFFPKWV